MALVSSSDSDSAFEDDLGLGRDVLYMFGVPHRSNNDIGNNVLQRYDFDDNDWRVVVSNMGSRRMFSTVVAYEECIWVIGGKISAGRPTNSVVIYNPKTETWEKGPSMMQKRHSFCAVVVDGAIYAIGGAYDDKVLCTTESYRSGKLGWAVRKPMHYPRRNFAIAARNRTIYAMGGNNDLKRSVNCSVECYRVEFDIWELDDKLMEKPRFGPKAAVVNDKLYVLGGDVRDTVAYKDLCASQEWIEISEIPRVPWHFDVVRFGTMLYVVGTMFEDLTRIHFDVFDTESHKWTPLARPIAEPFFSISAVVEKEYSRL